MNYTLGQTLYKIDSKGKIREWRIEVKDNGTYASVITTAGLQDGKQVETVIDVYEGKNIGRANETTYYTQAVADAISSAESKLRGEYRFTIEESSKGELRGGKAPMLAQKYHPTGEESSSKTLAKMGIEGELIHVQPKLDGLRCIALITPTSVHLRTRGGDKFEPIPHIESALRQMYDGADLNHEIELDGELYTTEITFSEISGALRKQKKTAEHLKNLQYIKFNVYDIMYDVGYKDRYQIIKNIVGDYFDSVTLIPSHEIIANDENINAKMEEFLAEGNEGLMIRTLNTPYENKRSWQLCKYKYFQEAEYEIADIEEDARGGFVGAFVMKCEPYVDRNGKERNTFNAGIKDLTQEDGAKILANKSDYIGKLGTVRFQIFTDYGIPLFPKFKELRTDL